MIVEIQSLLKQIVIQSTQLPSDLIHTDPPDSNTPKPYISILPTKATLTPAWHWDPAPLGKKIKRKYDVVQPIIITLEYKDKEELDQAIDQLLIDLPKEFVAQDISLSPIELEYFFTSGALGFYTAILTVHSIYAVREDVSDNTIIKSVDLTITQTN